MSDVIAMLKGLSSAEDFFAALDVPYDPARLGVARLHILKRMGEHLAGADLAGGDEAAVRAACADVLRAAYDEFAGRRPIEARLFKVLRDRDPKRPKGAFVSFDSLFG